MGWEWRPHANASAEEWIRKTCARRWRWERKMFSELRRIGGILSLGKQKGQGIVSWRNDRSTSRKEHRIIRRKTEVEPQWSIPNRCSVDQREKKGESNQLTLRMHTLRTRLFWSSASFRSFSSRSLSRIFFLLFTVLTSQRKGERACNSAHLD